MRFEKNIILCYVKQKEEIKNPLKLLLPGAQTKLARWYDYVELLNCKFFNSVIQTMQNNYGTIANYFENRSTNASAEFLVSKSRLSEISSEALATSLSLFLDLKPFLPKLFRLNPKNDMVAG